MKLKMILSVAFLLGSSHAFASVECSKDGDLALAIVRTNSEGIQKKKEFTFQNKDDAAKALEKCGAVTTAWSCKDTSHQETRYQGKSEIPYLQDVPEAQLSFKGKLSSTYSYWAVLGTPIDRCEIDIVDKAIAAMSSHTSWMGSLNQSGPTK